ncbi:MAG: amidohydrolase family protein [archaeon GB-1867-035]|nr:amidohydrolase family protein [Candidatus Culexmicrobium profundum]
MVYIDAHTHFGKKGKGLPPNTPEERIKMMDEIGMDAMVTTPPYASISYDRTYDEANAFILEVMQKYPDRFYGLARINPHFRKKAVERAEKWLKKGFWGIKFHPRNEAFPANSKELVFPIMEKVKELGGIVLFHTGEPDFSHPTLIGDVADHFPEIPIIIGHLGKIYYMDAILVAKWFDNVFVDTSFCQGVHVIEKAVEIAGAEKVLYASDYPQGSIELDTMKVQLADISKRDKELILGRNIKRILDEVKKKR